MKFEFATATRIIFGLGALREVGLLAKEFGLRALVVTGRDVRRAQQNCVGAAKFLFSR